jgi:signal transduction histidine kinase
MSAAMKTLILNVDDTEPLRYAKTRALRRAGYEVIEAATGSAGLALARERQPSLVLLDVKLPDISGLDVCRMIKAAQPSMLVLQTSASFVKAADRVAGLEGGADSYLAQPVAAEELVASVRALLRMGAAEAALREVNETLEKRVAHRTRELAAANRALQAEIEVREQAQEALRQSQKMEALGQLTGGIAHDFNNLLMGIIGNVEFVLRKLPDEASDVKRHADAALASASRAATLTQRLLAFSRRQALQPESVDLDALVEETSDLIRRTVGESINVVTARTQSPWHGWCDANQMVNALLNLAINARDAMPEGGTLTIETANITLDEVYTARFLDLQPGDYTMIAVSDTGVGMAPDVVARAFDPFFTTKPIGQGTGLGLSMVYGFIKQSSGHARIHSEPGLGTTVRLYVPRDHGSEVAEAAPAAASRPAAPGGAWNVLVVEDDTMVRDLVVQVLEDEAYTVLQAVDGPEALRTIESATPLHLMVTDVGLPGMNGRQLAEIARNHRPDLKILFTTGYAHNAALDGIAALDGVAVMSKPFQLDQLTAKVREMISPA